MREPAHIHVDTPDGECKFWLEPVRLARNKGVNLVSIEPDEMAMLADIDVDFRSVG